MGILVIHNMIIEHSISMYKTMLNSAVLLRERSRTGQDKEFKLTLQNPF